MQEYDQLANLEYFLLMAWLFAIFILSGSSTLFEKDTAVVDFGLGFHFASAFGTYIDFA